MKCCSSCSSNKNKKNNGTVTTTPTQETTTAPTESDYSKTVYLSPSNQEDNAFYVGDTNEAAVCRILAQKTAAILEQSGVTVIVAGDNDSIQTKTAMGDKNLAAYVAIHTNADTGRISTRNEIYELSGEQTKMQLKPEEISKIIRAQIKHYENAIEQSETGSVIMVGDGIALRTFVMYFPGGIPISCLNTRTRWLFVTPSCSLSSSTP